MARRRRVPYCSARHRTSPCGGGGGSRSLVRTRLHFGHRQHKEQTQSRALGADIVKASPMETIPDLLAAGLQYHQAGHLAEAEQIYRQILHAEPYHADALHLLGEIAYRYGQNDLAIDHISRAIAINPY